MPPNLTQAAKHASIDAYMRTHTREHEPLLDPSGRERLWPSQVLAAVPPRLHLPGANDGVDDSCLMPKRYRSEVGGVHGRAVLLHGLLLV